MISFITTIQRFDKKGDKTRWSFIEISKSQVAKLLPGQKLTFRVKGSLDSYTFEKTAVLPMGDGNFILPVNASMRKAIGKKHGDKVKVTLDADTRKLQLSPDLMASLKEEDGALAFFKTLPPSHQAYFSKWIESAKTTDTKTRRIVMTVIALGRKQGYGEMIRENKKKEF